MAGEPAAASAEVPLKVVVHARGAVEARVAAWLAMQPVAEHPARDVRWLRILRQGLGHEPLLLEALAGQTSLGLLPLAQVQSWLFGRMLVSLPYVNLGGVQLAAKVRDADQADAVARALLDAAVQLADARKVRYLELRQQSAANHPALSEASTEKVRMVLALPENAEALWEGFKSKLRSQIKSGQKRGLAIAWGASELLEEFYAVFACNMRDLGTPVYPRRLFAAILQHFGPQAELCVVRMGGQPIAAALLVHGQGVSEVPSASSLRAFNHTGANMVLYWNLLARACQRGQRAFDFGRSSVGSGTFRFKEQWGAVPEPSCWQYYVRRGTSRDVRPDQPRYRLAIEVWKRLPVWLTRWLGPPIVRGIP
jgi:FemAB-related protein (PEP-CTERM system-associated)